MINNSPEHRPQPVRKFPSSYEIQRFITAFTTACHLSPSSAISIRSTLISWRSVFILSSHLRLGFSSCLLPPGLDTETPLCNFSLPHTCSMRRPSHFSRFDHSIFGEAYKMVITFKFMVNETQWDQTNSAENQSHLSAHLNRKAFEFHWHQFRLRNSVFCGRVFFYVGNKFDKLLLQLRIPHILFPLKHYYIS
jgi:hypothetical protein